MGRKEKFSYEERLEAVERYKRGQGRGIYMTKGRLTTLEVRIDVSPKERLYNHADGMGDFLDFDRYTSAVKKLATELIKK